ncbi:MAG: pinensin family lanthipeptide [Acidobacteriota bacterium]|nr:pinensin family lanthipeptide [Acidobacteriota bacterium]
MKKMNLDTLRVQSFITGSQAKGGLAIDGETFSAGHTLCANLDCTVVAICQRQ